MKIALIVSVLAFAFAVDACAGLGLYKGVNYGLGCGANLGYEAGLGYGAGLGCGTGLGCGGLGLGGLGCGGAANVININKPGLLTKCLLRRKKLINKKLWLCDPDCGLGLGCGRYGGCSGLGFGGCGLGLGGCGLGLGGLGYNRLGLGCGGLGYGGCGLGYGKKLCLNL